MTIASTDHSTTLQIRRGSFDSPPDIDVELGCLGLSATEINIFPLEFESFLHRMTEFEATRKGAVELEGTEGFHLRFEPWGSTGDAKVSCRIENQKVGSDSRARQQLEVDFRVGGEFLGGIVREFRRLLAPE